MNRIRKGDEVIIISGKDKGRKGIVLALDVDRVFVEGVNLVKKHRKATGNTGGGIQEKELSIHISKVMLYNPTLKRGARIGYKLNDSGRKVRYFKSTGELLNE